MMRELFPVATAGTQGQGWVPALVMEELSKAFGQPDFPGNRATMRGYGRGADSRGTPLPHPPHPPHELSGIP